MGTIVEWKSIAGGRSSRMRSGSNSAQLESLLTVSQIVNSSFPTGSFSHSYGLETLIARGEVSDAGSLEKLCRSWLRYNVCTADGVAAVQAYRAALTDDLARLEEIDRRIAAMRLTRETRSASVLTGRALLAAAQIAIDSPILRRLADSSSGAADGVQHPVVFGAVMALAGVAEDEGVALFLQSSFGTLVAVGARLVPIGQSQVQSILTRGRQLFVDCARISQSRSLEQMSAASTRLDIASMQHERQESRLCMS